MEIATKRYYLHKKIKQYGAIVFPRQRKIELEDQLFRYPTPLLMSYIYRLKNLNYSIQSVIMKPQSKKSSTSLAKSESLIAVDVIKDKLVKVNQRLPELDKDSASLKVISDQTLVIAQNNASEVAGYIKEVESVRKGLKEPYLATSKMIDSYCNTVDDMLKRIKTRLTSEIANYKVVQEASARAEQVKKELEIAQEKKEKETEFAKISRIEKQLNARIYGGSYSTKDGNTVSTAGCIKSADCDALLIWINDTAPSPDTFKYFSVMFEETIQRTKKKLSEHKAQLINIETNVDKETINESMAAISHNRTKADIESNAKIEEVSRKIDKEARKEEKNVQAEVDEAGKGLRSILKYIIQDENMLPRDFFSVDEKKVTNYINANREKIKEDLLAGKETLPGIKFYIEDVYAVR